MRVLVLTTSYPRGTDDVAGTFVAAGVEALREAGVEVRVVSPADFPHFGVAFGHGIVQNVRTRPWLALLLPAFLVSYALAARRAARGVDVVHAHWLPSALPALATGKPFVLQVWGTDMELARRVPWLARLLLRRAPAVVAGSAFLAEEARVLGARDVQVVAPPVPVPDRVGDSAEPPHVLYVGRLSEEKGILDFLEATAGLPRVIVGDGPLRDRVSEAVGFVPPRELGGFYNRAAVVCVPSRREGYGMVAREAMAHGRALVVSVVGGLVDVAIAGVTVGVPPRDVGQLREEISQLLNDGDRRRLLGDAARDHARKALSSTAVAGQLVTLYGELLSRGTSVPKVRG